MSRVPRRRRVRSAARALHCAAVTAWWQATQSVRRFSSPHRPPPSYTCTHRVSRSVISEEERPGGAGSRSWLRGQVRGQGQAAPLGRMQPFRLERAGGDGWVHIEPRQAVRAEGSLKRGGNKEGRTRCSLLEGWQQWDGIKKGIFGKRRGKGRLS
eukprot:56533-Chlamydomonas_euryale.AAC.1